MARPTTEELLVLCFEHDEPRRALEEVCREHPRVATKLRRRFDLAEQMGLVDRVDALRPARRIGEFTLIREIGRGGMGVVWLAEQCSLQRRVALKVMRPGFGTDGLARRLVHEAAILGRLQHPGIAHIYEAGSVEFDDGLVQPYFAMEYIEGQALDRYVCTQELGLSERVRLATRICDAVAHAHEHGVIHRDLKPDNVLVDRTGQPKVLDFGIARATDCDVARVSMQTSTGQIIGTLPYMSPEQAIGDSRAIDARTDVYAIGAILYQMVAGHPPVAVEGKSIAEAARLIGDVEPKRLGAVDAACRGDLETIVGKALAKERTERYLSAAELGEDLRRSLRNDPIVARPPSTFYYLRKFARRNKSLVCGVLATFATLALGVVVASWFAVRAAHSEGLAGRRARASALRAAETALRDRDPMTAGRILTGIDESNRGWEWSHLNSRLHDALAVLEAPTGGGIDVRPIASGSRFLIDTRYADGRRSTESFDPWSGVRRPERRPPEQAKDPSPNLSPTGKRRIEVELRSRSDITYWLVDSSDGRRRKLAVPKTTARVHWLTDDKLAVEPRDGAGVYLLELSSARVTRLVKPAAAGPIRAVPSPDRTRVAVLYGDGRIWLHAATNGRLLASCHDHRKGVYHARFLSANRLATVSNDATVRLFDSHTLVPLRVMYGHRSRLSQLLVSGDETTLATRRFGDNTRWCFWDSSRRDPRKLLGHASFVYAAAWHPDGRRLVSGGWLGRGRRGELALWDVGKRSRIGAPVETAGYVCSIAFSPDGRRVGTLEYGGVVRIFEVGTDGLELVAKREGYEGSRFVAPTFHPDGVRVLWPRGDRFDIWDPMTGTTRAASRGLLGEFDAGHVAADGSAVTTLDGASFRCCDIRRGSSIRIPAHGRYQQFVYLQHQTLGLLVLVPRNDESGKRRNVPVDVAVVAARTGNIVAVLQGSGEVLGVAVSERAGRIAVASRDGAIRLWDSNTFDELVALRGHAAYVIGLAWNPDGTTLVSTSGDTTVRLWETRPIGETLRELRGRR